LIKVLIFGLILAIAPWFVLDAVESYDPMAMPVGLGILSIIASFAGAVIAAVGLVGLIRVTIAARRQQSADRQNGERIRRFRSAWLSRQFRCHSRFAMIPTLASMAAAASRQTSSR